MSVLWLETGFPWDSEFGRAALRVRWEVFVMEQRVPFDEEVDATDPLAFHVLVLKEDYDLFGAGPLSGKPVATGRWYEWEGNGRIGRMAVCASARGLGLGAMVMRALLEEGARRGMRRHVLDAQNHAIPFYQKFGFKVCGPEHLDCGIPHHLMERLD
jgi:predicted GNAT family N-acyltransferase